MKKSESGRGKRIWDQTDTTMVVEVPLTDWVKATRIPTPYFRIEAVNPVMYHVTDPFGGNWEVVVMADGTTEIVFPEEVSGNTKKKILVAIREYLQDNN